MTRRIFIFLQAIIFISLPAYAEELTMDDYVQKLAEHPQVLQIMSTSDRFNELSYGEMGLPDPTLSLGVDNVPVQSGAFDEFLPTSRTIGFTQMFPSYSLRKAKSGKQKQLSVKQQTIAEFTREQLKAMLISSLVELDKVQKQQKYAHEQIQHYKSLEEYFKGRLESGSNVYWRFSQVDVERSLIEQQLNNLLAERETIEAELTRLVGEVPTLKVSSFKNKDWQSPEDLYPIRIAKEDINVAKFGVTAANAAFNPNYGITAMYKQREDGTNFSGEDWFSVKGTVTIPLWYKWNQAPKKRAALAKKYSAEQLLEDTKLAVIKTLSSLESKRGAALKNVRVLKSKTTALKEMIAATKRTYESGETGLEALLDAKINLLSIKSQLAEQQFKHLALSAKINSYIGK